MSNETGNQKSSSPAKVWPYGPQLEAHRRYRIVRNSDKSEVVLAGAKLVEHVQAVAGPLWTAAIIRFGFFPAPPADKLALEA